LEIQEEEHLKRAVGGTYSNRPVIFDKSSFSMGKPFLAASWPRSAVLSYLSINAE
jgi:hypothetical protein